MQVTSCIHRIAPTVLNHSNIMCSPMVYFLSSPSDLVQREQDVKLMRKRTLGITRYVTLHQSLVDRHGAKALR